MSLPLSPPEPPELPWCDDCEEPHERDALIVEGLSCCIPFFFVKTVDVAYSLSCASNSSLFLVCGVPVPKTLYESLRSTQEWQIIKRAYPSLASDKCHDCWIDILCNFRFNYCDMEVEYAYSLCIEKKSHDTHGLYFARKVIEVSEL